MYLSDIGGPSLFVLYKQSTSMMVPALEINLNKYKYRYRLLLNVNHYIQYAVFHAFPN